MGLKVALIGTDTLHRRFMINSLIDAGIDVRQCIFETNTLSAKFPVDPKWKDQEQADLAAAFADRTGNDLDRVGAVTYVETLNAAAAIDELEQGDADFVVVSGAGWIKGDLLKAINGKSLNVHMGKAEAYRGLDSNLWALYHRDYANLGVTLHVLSDDLDTGDIYRYADLSLPDQMPIWMLRYYESASAVEMILDVLAEVAAGTPKTRKQQAVGRYYSFIPAVIKDILPLHISTTGKGL